MNQKLVYLAMSGGVDSSVAAALLKKQSYDVIGVYMKNWHSSDPRFADVCPWEQDLRDARAVAARLEIPLKVWNFEKQYHDRVVRYFFNEYQKGRTPNPDVMCNSQIKFGEFYKKAMAEGADFIATGHYARVRVKSKKQDTRYKQIINQKIQNIKTEQYQLLAGKDKSKDQSYFLWDIDKKVLSKTLMPIGQYQKSEIRKMAKKFNLPVAQKKDSQGICFIGPINVREYLQTQLPIKKGDIELSNGTNVGEHDGIWFYTEGQRQGIGTTGGGVPYYIVKKDVKQNKLIVAPRASKLLLARGLVAKNINWLTKKINPLSPAVRSFSEGGPAQKIQARIRYRHPAVLSGITVKKDHARILFDTPQRAVTPGQSVVFYQNDVVLGGGIIEKAVL